MKFDAEICKGVRCPECAFNKGKDGCLLAKRLDEIEIIPEPCEDAVPRTSVEYICRKNTVSTNPYEHKYHDKFIQFMDDPEISDFGRWQHSNGFNTALVAVKCDLDKVPSVQPEIIRCQDCEYWIPGNVTDNDDFIPPRCGKYQQMVGHSADDYCNYAERKEDNHETD